MPKDLFFTINKEKKDRIIEAAVTEFSHQMYEKASINQIIKEADISRGSFYEYFEDKEDLYFFLINTIVKSTSYNFLKAFIATRPKDIFAVYKALLTYNLQLLSDEKYQAFFKNMYLGLNYQLQQELRTIFSEIRNEMLEGKFNQLQEESGYKGPYFQQLMNMLELNNRDLLMYYISDAIDIKTIMEIYELRIQILRGNKK